MGIVTGLTLIASGLVPSASASAGGSLTQAAPLQGDVMVGNAFADQLQVTGATGTVTFTQTDGSANITVSSSGQLSAAGSLAAGTYSASGTDVDSNNDTGTWTYSLNVLQPAPSGYGDTLVSIYQSVYSVAQQLGQSSSAEPVSQYQQSVSQLSPTDLAVVYNALQKDPGWDQIPSVMQSVSTSISGLSSGSTSAPPSGSAVQRALSATKSVKARSNTKARVGPAAKSATPGSHLAAGAAVANGTPVAPYTPNQNASIPNSTCNAAINFDGALFGLQVVVDTAQGAYNGTMALTVGDPEPGSKVILAIIAGVESIVLYVAQIAHDVTAYYTSLYNDCITGNIYGFVSNIDNTTTQTYALFSTISSTIAQVQSTSQTTQQDVLNTQAQLTALQNTLLSTIASDTQTLQSTIGSDTQAVTSQIEQDLSALTNDVNSIQTSEATLSQGVISQVNTDTSQVQSSLSSDLTKILNETDNQASDLTTLVTQGNQQVMNTLQSNYKTQQGEYYSDLKVQIEKALGSNGAPPVQYVLPAAQGGFINSTPVGVQEVVTDDLNAMVTIGTKIPSSATNDLKLANAALAAGQYAAAYGYYAACYQQFA
jgi:hypothetical protein